MLATVAPVEIATINGRHIRSGSSMPQATFGTARIVASFVHVHLSTHVLTILCRVLYSLNLHERNDSIFSGQNVCSRTRVALYFIAAGRFNLTGLEMMLLFVGLAHRTISSMKLQNQQFSQQNPGKKCTVLGMEQADNYISSLHLITNQPHKIWVLLT